MHGHGPQVPAGRAALRRPWHAASSLRTLRGRFGCCDRQHVGAGAMSATHSSACGLQGRCSTAPAARQHTRDVHRCFASGPPRSRCDSLHLLQISRAARCEGACVIGRCAERRQWCCGPAAAKRQASAGQRARGVPCRAAQAQQGEPQDHAPAERRAGLGRFYCAVTGRAPARARLPGPAAVPQLRAHPAVVVRLPG